MIEGNVFLKNDDYMLDGRSGDVGVVGLDREREGCTKREAYTCADSRYLQFCIHFVAL